MTMGGRRKTIVLSDDEYKKLELARIKYESATRERVNAFGEVVAFLADKYLTNGRKPDAESEG